MLLRFRERCPPFRYQIEQPAALLVIHRRGLEPFGVDRLTVLPASKHLIRYTIVQSCLFALGLVEAIQQCEGLVVLLAQRTNGFSIQRVKRGLCSGQARRENAARARTGASMDRFRKEFRGWKTFSKPRRLSADETNASAAERCEPLNSPILRPARGTILTGKLDHLARCCSSLNANKTR